MYYKYLKRDQLYLRSYRTHNLWLEMYSKKIRQPVITAFHIGILRRLSKNYANERVVCLIYGLTVLSFVKFLTGFSSTTSKDPKDAEIYFRLNSILSKNKYGFNTRFMYDFDILLEGVLNERFIDESTVYYDNPVVLKEIEDMELGLNGEVSESDIKEWLKDHHEHGSVDKCLQYPARVGTNYEKSDDLSVYKVHPLGEKPKL